MSKRRHYDTPIGKLPRVTDILGVLDKPWMANWIKAEAAEAIAKFIIWPSGLKVATAFEPASLTADIKRCLDEHKRISRTALDIGSLAHKFVEIYHKRWRGTRAKYLDFVERTAGSKIRMLVRTYFKALSEHGLEIVQSEQTVYHTAGYAGTLDNIARHTASAGQHYIGDLKFSKRISWEYYLQTEAYRRAYCEMSSPPYAVHRYILRIDKEKIGKYEIKFITDPELHDEHWQAFLACLTIHKLRR